MLSLQKFKGLFWTQFLGAFNDNFFKNALVILITYQAMKIGKLSPQAMVTLSAGIFILPFFLFSSLAGQIADKYSKTKLTHWIKLAEILIMTFGAIGFFFKNIDFLLIVLFLMGLQSTFFGPIKYSVLPQLLDKEELVSGNAWIEMGTFLAILLGTIGGGLLIGIAGGLIYVSIGVILFALIGYRTSLWIPKTSPQDPGLKISYNLVKETWNLFIYTRGNIKVFLSVLAISWFWGFGAAFLSLFPIYGKDVLSANEQVVTFFLALFSVGIGIGSMICDKLSKGKININLVFWGAIGMALFAIDLFWIAQPRVYISANDSLIGLQGFLSHLIGYRITFDLLMLSVFSGMFIVPLYTIMQKESHPEHRSRVIAGNNVLNSFAIVFTSLLLTTLIGKGVRVPNIFLMIAALHLLICGILWARYKKIELEV